MCRWLLPQDSVGWVPQRHRPPLVAPAPHHPAQFERQQAGLAGLSFDEGEFGCAAAAARVPCLRWRYYGRPAGPTLP